MTIQDLYDKRNKLVEDAREFLEECTDADGKISAEDAAAYDKMEVDVLALEKQIERFENQEKREQNLSALQPIPPGILSQPNGNSFAGKSSRASDEYKKAAIEAIRSFLNIIFSLHFSRTRNRAIDVVNMPCFKFLSATRTNSFIILLCLVSFVAGH